MMRTYSRVYELFRALRFKKVCRIFWKEHRSLLINMSILLCSIGVALGGIEFYFRWSHPSVTAINSFQVAWPSRFDSQLGFIFEPDATVRWTNYLDFAVEQRANSLGFLDREHTFPKPKDTFRILVLGDSFVEAAQVELEKKFHILLERHLNAAYPFKNFEIIALGYSGTGTSNVLSFYEEIGQKFEPDLVIIVFVNNDFANNSPLLESLRNGWAPYHPPRLFFEKSGDDDFTRIEIDPEWTDHQLNIEEVKTLDKPTRLKKADTFLRPFCGWSVFYTWTIKALERKFQTTSVYYQKMALRAKFLQQEQHFAEQLRGWNFPADLDIDRMFHAEQMPPVFQNAVDITDHVIKVFQGYSYENNFKLMIVAAENCSFSPSANSKGGRAIIKYGGLKRIQRIAEKNRIPFLNLFESFSQKGDPFKDAHWKYDGHWNITGHQWVAEALFEYLTTEEDTWLSSSATVYIHSQSPMRDGSDTGISYNKRNAEK